LAGDRAQIFRLKRDGQAEGGLKGLGQHPKNVDFADIVNQSEPRTRPLYIHFTFRAQSKAVHTFVHTDVGKDRLDNAQSPGVDALSLLSVDLGHRVAGVDSVCPHCAAGTRGSRKSPKPQKMPVHWRLPFQF